LSSSAKDDEFCPPLRKATAQRVALEGTQRSAQVAAVTSETSETCPAAAVVDGDNLSRKNGRLVRWDSITAS
jgi:hypothetical protein